MYTAAIPFLNVADRIRELNDAVCARTKAERFHEAYRLLFGQTGASDIHQFQNGYFPFAKVQNLA